MNLVTFIIACIFFSGCTATAGSSESQEKTMPLPSNFPSLLDESESLTEKLPPQEEDDFFEDFGIDSENPMPEISRKICPPCNCSAKS